MNNTIIESVGLNTSINVTQEIVFTELRIDAAYIGFYNLSKSNIKDNGSYFFSDFKISEENKRYRGTDLPYVSRNDTGLIQIKSNITTPINTTLRINVSSCNQQTIVFRSNNNTYNRAYTESQFTCLNNKTLILNLTGIERGTNNITYNNVELLINIRDEMTGNLIYRNATVELLRDGFNSTTIYINGTRTTTLAGFNNYTITYGIPGYGTRYYYLLIPYITTGNISLNLYLLNLSLSSDATLYVRNEFDRVVEGAVIKVLRFDSVTGTYPLVNILKTNFEGMTVGDFVYDTQYYKFLIEYPITTLRFTSNPTPIYTSPVYFRINTGTTIGSQYFNELGITFNISFNNATSNFIYTYTDSKNAISGSCLKVYDTRISVHETLYNSSCLATSSGTIIVGVKPYAGASYEARAFVGYSPIDNFIGSLKYVYKTVQNFGKLGVLFVFMLTVVFAMLGFYNKTAALILTPIPVILGITFGLLQGLTMVAGVGILIINLVVAVVISKDG